MANDVKVSLTIEGTDTTGKKTSTKIPYINPTISNETMKDFAEKCAALSDDTYVGTTKTTEEDITDGGGGSTLIDAGYTFNNDGSATTNPAGIINVQTYSGKNYMVEFNVISLAGDNTIETATFSGLKPKGSNIVVEDGGFVLRFSKDVTYSQGTGNYQMQIHIAATDTYKAATLYLYFYANAEDMEEI